MCVCAWGQWDTLTASNQIVAHFTVLPCNICFIPEIIQLLSLLDSDIFIILKAYAKTANETPFLMSESQTDKSSCCM